MQEEGERSRENHAINDSAVDGEPISILLMGCEKFTSSKLKTRNHLSAQHAVDRQRASTANRYSKGHEHQRHRVLDATAFSRSRRKKKAMAPSGSKTSRTPINTARPKATGRTKKPSTMHTTVDSSITSAKTPMGTGIPLLIAPVGYLRFRPLAAMPSERMLRPMHKKGHRQDRNEEKETHKYRRFEKSSPLPAPPCHHSKLIQPASGRT